MDLRLTARGDVDCAVELVNDDEPAGGIALYWAKHMLARPVQVTTGPSAGNFAALGRCDATDAIHSHAVVKRRR